MLKKIFVILVPALTALGLGGLAHSANNIRTGEVKTNVKVKVDTNVKVGDARTNVRVNSNSSKKALGSVSKNVEEAFSTVYFDSLGNVSIVDSGDSVPTAELSYEVQGASQEQCDLISENLDMVCSVENGVLTVEYYCNGKKIEKSLSEIKEGYNLSASLKISVTGRTKDFDVHSVLGNLSLENVSGNFLIITDQGNITIDSACLSNGSQFSTGLGNIKADGITLSGLGELKTNQGNIAVTSDKLRLDGGVMTSIENEEYTLSVLTGLGTIKFNNEKATF